MCLWCRRPRGATWMLGLSRALISRSLGEALGGSVTSEVEESCGDSVGRAGVRTPRRAVADVPEELDDRVRAEICGNSSTDVKHRVDLDEVESNDSRLLGQRDQRVAQLGIGEPVRLAG